VWHSSALVGTTPENFCYVELERTTMTRYDIDNDRLIDNVGIASPRPAEFVILRISENPADASS
jgi:uncharacterized protein